MPTMPMSSPWEAAWGWQVRPTPARLKAITSCASDLKVARSPIWATCLTDAGAARAQGGAARPANPIVEAMAAWARLSPGDGPANTGDSGVSGPSEGGNGRGLGSWVGTELLQTLGYTISARVAALRQGAGHQEEAGEGTPPSTAHGRRLWRQLESELQDARPLRSLLHAARLAVCGVTMRPLLATGAPRSPRQPSAEPKSGYDSGEGEVLRR